MLRRLKTISHSYFWEVPAKIALASTNMWSTGDIHWQFFGTVQILWLFSLRVVLQKKISGSYIFIPFFNVNFSWINLYTHYDDWNMCPMKSLKFNNICESFCIFWVREIPVMLLAIVSLREDQWRHSEKKNIFTFDTVGENPYCSVTLMGMWWNALLLSFWKQ